MGLISFLVLCLKISVLKINHLKSNLILIVNKKYETCSEFSVLFD